MSIHRWIVSTSAAGHGPSQGICLLRSAPTIASRILGNIGVIEQIKGSHHRAPILRTEHWSTSRSRLIPSRSPADVMSVPPRHRGPFDISRFERRLGRYRRTRRPFARPNHLSVSAPAPAHRGLSPVSSWFSPYRSEAPSWAVPASRPMSCPSSSTSER